VRDGAVFGTKGHPGSPHPVVVNPIFLSEQVCLGCHNVSGELSPVLICTFETGDEWMMTTKKEEGSNCISCHMPVVKRAISEFGKEYESHRHNFPGSGIPKFADMEIEGLQGLEITEDGIKSNYNKDDTLVYVLKIKNSYAGHSLPTGDPERFYLIDFRLLDSQGVIIDYEQFRIGEEWQWYPVAKKVSDNNIKSLEEREFHFSTKLPASGQLNLEVEITKHRITKENAEYNRLSEEYPRFISIFRRTHKISIGS
jgi:hypothetical protein